MAANYKNTYTMNVSLQQLCDVIRSQAFADKLRVLMKSENPTPTGVWYRFHHGTSFTSWGEKITITLTPLAANLTQVDIHSECGMPTQVIDWGKNKQVVCNVYEYLEANAPYAPVAPATPTAPAAPMAPAQPIAPSAPRFCTSCGAPVELPSNFCSRCGAKLL